MKFSEKSFYHRKSQKWFKIVYIKSCYKYLNQLNKHNINREFALDD